MTISAIAPSRPNCFTRSWSVCLARASCPEKVWMTYQDAATTPSICLRPHDRASWPDRPHQPGKRPVHREETGCNQRHQDDDADRSAEGLLLGGPGDLLPL